MHARLRSQSESSGPSKADRKPWQRLMGVSRPLLGFNPSGVEQPSDDSRWLKLHRTPFITLADRWLPAETYVCGAHWAPWRWTHHARSVAPNPAIQAAKGGTNGEVLQWLSIGEPGRWCATACWRQLAGQLIRAYHVSITTYGGQSIEREREKYYYPLLAGKANLGPTSAWWH